MPEPSRPTGMEPAQRAEGAVSSGPADSAIPARATKSFAFVLPKVRLVNVHPRLVERVEASYEAASKALDNPGKLGELGMLYYVAMDSSAAATCFSRAVELDPKSPRWWYYLGMAEEVGYEKDQAIRAYRAVLALDPKYAPAMVDLAGLLTEANPAEAKSLYQKSVELNPEDVRAYVGLGQAAEKGKDVDLAASYYREALRRCPDYAQAHQAFARLLTAAGRTEEAKIHLNFFKRGAAPPTVNDPLLVDLLSKSTNTVFLTRLAQRLARGRRYEDALGVMSKALELDGRPQVRENLGVILAMQGRFAEAATRFAEALKEDPFNESAKVNLGKACVELGRYREASELLQTVLDRHPKDTTALRRYGALLLILGRAREAELILTALATVDPEDPENWLDLATCLAYLNRLDEAIERYERAKKLMFEPNNGPTAFLDRFRAIAAKRRTHPPPSSQPGSRLYPPDFGALAQRFKARSLEAEAHEAQRLLDESAPKG